MANIDSLVEVIKANLTKGVPAEKLVESAKAAGWSDEDIRAAFQQVNQPAPVESTPQPTPAPQPTTQTTQNTQAAQSVQQISTQPVQKPAGEATRNKFAELKQTLTAIIFHPKATLEEEAKTDATLAQSLKKLATQGALTGAFLSVGIMYLLILLALIAPDVLSNFEILAFTDIIGGIVTLLGITLALTIGLAILLPISELINNAGTLIVAKIAGGKGTYAKQLQLTSHAHWISVGTCALLLVPIIGLLATLLLSIPLGLVRLYAVIRAVQFAHGFSGKKAAVIILLPAILLTTLQFLLQTFLLGSMNSG